MTPTEINKALIGRHVNMRDALAELCIDLDTFDISSLTVEQCCNCNVIAQSHHLKDGLCRVCDSFLN